MKLHDISKTYHNKNNTVLALNHINVDISTNGITVILGPSGCGKTTLMNIIAGWIPYEGTIENIPNFDYLTQDFNLFENMSVMENLILVSKKRKRIRILLDEFEMTDFQNRKVKKLSNGQKKRVQFIRALLHRPGLLLCDEPTAALDHENAELLMNELKKLSSFMQIILVTHDTLLAEQYADRVITMDKGTIIKDEVIHSCTPSDNGKKMKHHALKSTFLLSVKRLKTELPSTVSSFLLSALCVLSVFSILNLRNNISRQSNYADTFKNAENMIVSIPDKSSGFQDGFNNSMHYGTFYTDTTTEDLFGFEDTEKIIQNHPEIIAVESFNSEQYQNMFYAQYSYDPRNSKEFPTYTYNNSTLANIPYESPFMIDQDPAETYYEEN